MKRAVAVLAALLTAASLVTGCGKPATPDRDNGGKITVVADPALAPILQPFETAFEQANPGTDVVIGYAAGRRATSQLSAVDVLVAPAATIATVPKSSPQSLGRTQLVVAVEPGNPRKIAKLADLAQAKVAICQAAVPCGDVAYEVLSKAGVTLAKPVEVADIKEAMDKLTLGNVEAALVYRTDALAAIGQVDSVEFAESAGAAEEFQVTTLSGSPNPAGAKAFLDLLTSADARTRFTEGGFTQSS
ncbi:MAG: extracellular solute-binding protein [Hamadaea sp.]|uniref:molybdate ABC transporter substrate-binding protein n=1 Tax=Hamadaea sp. TaxID=2024425 RepID=UPI00184F462A|nr:extracellular solute-binding protein [Hamadaea sp.]NUR73520.1 extracellular solute-binding protein [Hamadaea sp.]NUT22665.1 extracellular solute-binding protein [Hamadaea sp.]